MQLTLLKGYPDFVGKRATFVGYGNGPVLYVPFTAGVAPAAATGGDPITLPMPNWYIDAIDSGATFTVSGAYFVRAASVGVGPRQKWVLAWFLAAGGPASGNLSAEQIQISGKCGQY